MPGPTGVGPRRYDERLCQREIRRLVLNPLMGSLRSGIAQATSASDALRILNAAGLDLELEVREYDGDPVQWVIGRNLHRRHLTELRRASCVSAALDWAEQGHQKRLDRDDSGQFTIGSNLDPMDAPVSPFLTQIDSRQAEQQPLLTRDERAGLADVSERTQKRSDDFEKAGLGPEIRSGAIFLAQKRMVRAVGALVAVLLAAGSGRPSWNGGHWR